MHKRKKQSCVRWKQCRDAVQTCRNVVRKAKACLDTILGRDMKGSREGFYKYIISKRMTRENICLLRNGNRDLVLKDMGKAEALTAFFALVFTGKTSCE